MVHYWPKRVAPEDTYYEHLFTKSGYYSSPALNPEELLRWNHIETLVQQALRLTHQTTFKKIIDYGCGRGWLANALKKYGDPTGIEPVKAVVAYGKKIYPELDLQHGKLPLLEKFSPELIVCSEVIEHIEKAEQVHYFRSFYERLRSSKGFLIITTPRGEVLADWVQSMSTAQPLEEWLTEEELRSQAQSAGFQVVDKITYAVSPVPFSKPIEVYQQWLFRV